MTDSGRTTPFSRDLRRWPTDPAQLVDTRLCPACLSWLTSSTCGVCGLDLAAPAATELYASAVRVHEAEVERQGIITRMRAEQATMSLRPPLPVASVPQATIPPATPAAVAAAPVTAVPVTAASVAVAPESAARPVAASPPTPTPGATTDAEAAARPRRSGVQVLLLTLGVVLLAVAAIVFLFVAYIIATLEVRSIVIAIASVLVLALAWLLRARGLPGTAEGVAILAVVLLVLDVWIIRENALFGSAGLDGPGYWGGALIILAALLAGARFASRVRATGIAAAVLAPVGLFVLSYGVAPADEPGTGLWLGGLAVALAAAGVRFARPSIERTVVMGIGLAGGGIALLAALQALPDVVWGITWALLAVAVAWILLVVSLRLRTTDDWSRIAPLAATVASVAAASAPVLGAVAELDPAEAIWVAPASAGAVACLAAAATRTRGRWARDGMPAFIAASSIALLAALPAANDGLLLFGPPLLAAFERWSLDATELHESIYGDRATGVVLALLALGVLAAIALVLLRRLVQLGAIPVGLLLGAAVASAVTAPTLLGNVGLLLGVAVGGLALAVLRLAHRIPAATVVLAAFGMTSAALAWAVAHGSAALWWWTVLAVVALAVAGRALAARVWTPALAVVLGPLHLGTAVVVAVLGALALPAWADAAGRPFAAPWESGTFVAALGCAVALGALAFVPWLRAWDLLALAIPLFAGALLGSLAFVLDLPATPYGWVPALVLALVGIAWLRSPVVSLAVAFAASTPLASAFAGAGLMSEFGDDDLVVHGFAGAALVAAVLAHAIVPRDRPVRDTWSLAVGVVGVIALQVGLTPPAAPDQTWLALLVLAPVPLLIAALDGDPIGGTAPTRHLSWVSLALTVGAVWAWLQAGDVQDTEAYTLPLAGALLAAGVLIMWRRGDPGSTAAGRTAVLGAAAAIAVLPSVAQAGGSELRTLILATAGAVAVLAGLFLPERIRGVPIRLLVATTGWAAVTGAAVVRGTAVALDEPSVLAIEFWPLVALATGGFAAVAWARSEARPAMVAEWGLAASVALAAVPTVVAILDDDDATLRAAVLFPVLAAVHVASVALRVRPIAGPVMTWTSLGVMVAAGAVVLASGRVDPFDVVTVPVGAALVGAGAARMRRDRTRRSWPALGPGLGVVLVPALLADWTDPDLWRLVALGIAAVVTVVAGAVLRLQAPLVLGGAVLLVHAVAQLWPWISWLYEAVWWWLWLGVAGALLVTIAATYERQLRLARGVVRTIAGLR